MATDVLRLMSEAMEGHRRKRRPAAPCRLCHGPTKGSVPACLEHVVDVMPYAAKVAAELSDRVDEARRLNAGRKPDPWGRLADEIADMLTLAPMRLGQIARLLDLGIEGAEALARAMAKAGRISLSRRGRGLELRRAEASKD